MCLLSDLENINLPKTVDTPIPDASDFVDERRFCAAGQKKVACNIVHHCSLESVKSTSP
jgi:hypothetical protein